MEQAVPVLHKRTVESEELQGSSGRESKRARRGRGAEKDNKKEEEVKEEVEESEPEYYISEKGYRCVRPYYYVFKCHAKGRWLGCSLIDTLTKEFCAHDYSYYEKKIKSGDIRLNGKIVECTAKFNNSDVLTHKVHRHEPPVSGSKIQIIKDTEDFVVIDKPSSIPVHPCGRYRQNSILFILSKEHNMRNLHSVHRLDRLTSGLLVLAKNKKEAARFSEQMQNKEINKRYIALVHGAFPEEVVDVKQAIEVRVARIGINECKEDGKPCRTVFKRIHYDAASNTSLVLCSPLTGRTHQIRVHLNWLGHPITNDPLYGLAPSLDSNSSISKDSQLNNPSIQQQASIPASLIDSKDYKSENNSALSTKSQSSTSENNQSSVSNQTALTNSNVSNQSTALTNTSVSNQSTALRIHNDLSALMASEDYDADCPDCKKYLLNAEEQQMSLYLHALTYQSPEWTFETALPNWALPYVPVPDLLHNAKQSIDTHITKMNDK